MCIAHPARLVSGWVISYLSILTVFGEGTFENGDPTEKHYADTPDQAGEEHDLQNVLAPKH
jgi:hypothetical protein